MSLVWLGFALYVGATSMLPGADVIGLVSGAIAGVIVLVPIGVVLGLLGGRWKETCIGGVSGLTIGGLAGLLTGQANALLVANTGLVGGALLGATFSTLFHRVRAVVLALAVASRRATPGKS
jgi:hypothetical protein